MTRDTYELQGHEVVEETAKPHGNGARVLVPKDWIGERVKVVRVTDGQNGHDTRFAPIAALMYTDAKRSADPSLRAAMEHVTLLQSFNDVDADIVADFEHALGTPDVFAGLQQRIRVADDPKKQEFYADLVESGRTPETLVTTLRDWT